MPTVAWTLLTYLSGFLVQASDSWNLLYKSNLFFHPLIGFVWAAAICRNLLSPRAERRDRRHVRHFRGLVLLFCIGIMVSAVTESLVGFWVAATLCGLLTLWVVLGKKGWKALRFPGLHETFRTLFLFGILWVSATGALILVLRHGHLLRPVFRLHAMGGTGLLVLSACMLLVVRFRNPDSLKEWAGRNLGLRSVSLYREMGFLAAVALLCIGLGAVDFKEKDVRYTFHLSTTPLEKRKAHEVDEIPADFPYAPLMASVESCGNGKGCHAGIVEDHHRSSHNRSIQTSYFQTNLEFLADEIGENNTYICAGCHFPNAYFLSGTGFRDYAKKDGWSCLYCHTVEQVRFTEEKGKTILTLKPNVKHLKMFASADRTDTMGPLNALMIQLNPQGHARTFRKDLYFRGEFCQVCHNLQIKPSESPGFMKAGCIDCHMQGRKWMGKEGQARNHFFPGTNLAGPADVGDQEAIRINRMYSRGELELPLRGWGGIWSLIPKEERKIKDIWLLLSIEPLDKPEPGKPFAYQIVTTNTSLDHAFPAAPLDLIEVWLETWVKDADGRVVFQSGVLDENYKIPADAHKLGGYMIGMDDHLVTKNRVWQIKKKVVEREILVNEQVEDRFSFTLPEDLPPGPLEVYASWNYRKLNQEFVDWAYNHDGTTVPILRIAEKRHSLHADPASTEPDAIQTPARPGPGSE